MNELPLQWANCMLQSECDKFVKNFGEPVDFDEAT